MRRLLLAGGALLFVVPQAPAAISRAAVRAPPAQTCAHRGELLQGDPRVQLIVSRAPAGKGRIYLACRIKTGRLFRLGVTDGQQGLRSVRAAGNWVAFENLVCEDGGGCTGAVWTWDLREPRPRAVVRLAPGSGAASDLYLDPGGAIATIRPRGGANEVYVRNRRLRGRILATGSDVETGSLAVANGRVYWSQGGVAQVYRTHIADFEINAQPGGVGLGRCWRPRTATVAVNSSARLLVTRGRVRSRAYGCLHSTGRLVRLPGDSGFRLAGPFAVAVTSFCTLVSEPGDCSAQATVLDLRTGKVVRAISTPAGVGGFEDLALTATGALAVLTGRPSRRVIVSDRAGQRDVGVLPPRSGGPHIAIAGERVYWMAGGTVQSVVLE